jgi:type II secretory pathway component GspD/PulD (secretin)
MLCTGLLWLFGSPLGSAVAQSRLHDLFNRMQQQVAAETTLEDTPEGPMLPSPRIEGMLPLAGADGAGDVQLSQNRNGRISLVVRDASLSRVLALLAQTQHLNIVAANDIDALISITLRDVPLEQALTAILSVANYTWVQRNNIILVTSLDGAANLPADVQGRQIEVFDLDFASAEAVAEAVTNFLSPIGKVTTSKSDPTDNRRTRELVIVEDVPESLARVAAYIHQVDCPPRQVLIEAHILQVTLDDETRNGVDFHALFRVAGATANILSVPSLAAPLPGPGELPTTPEAPAFLATIAGEDLQAVIEMLQKSTDTKSLGSPKLLVLNEQEAVVHVGESIGYQTSITTQTSVNQAPQFLDVGTSLRIVPRITRDCGVLLHVKPEVSTGEFDPVSNAPNKRTTELETDVMLRDGQGMIIGGLIKEGDTTTQQKVPYLGDVKGLGWFFRHSNVKKERDEIIFALIPRIQPYNPQYQAFEQGEIVKAGVPLYDGPLCRSDRPWDPILPDGERVYRPLVPRHLWNRGGPYYSPNSEYIIPPHPLPQQRFYGEPCDAAPLPQSQPFLSDEALPAPPTGGPYQQRGEIITDQE